MLYNERVLTQWTDWPICIFMHWLKNSPQSSKGNNRPVVLSSWLSVYCYRLLAWFAGLACCPTNCAFVQLLRPVYCVFVSKRRLSAVLLWDAAVFSGYFVVCEAGLLTARALIASIVEINCFGTVCACLVPCAFDCSALLESNFCSKPIVLSFALYIPNTRINHARFSIYKCGLCPFCW